MKPRPFLILLLFALNLVNNVSPAATIRVPADQPSIQHGIDFAAGGDTVLVSDGTYSGAGNRDIDFTGKDIVVTSVNGAESVVVDCERSGRGFRFHGGEGAGSVLKGISIRNGFAQEGGGIHCFEASPSIEDCVLTGNTAVIYGGGIYIENASGITIRGCTVSGNTVQNDWRGGGGLYTVGGEDVTISACVFSGNRATGNDSKGGAIYCDSGVQTIENCIITGNSAVRKAGAIYNEDSVTRVKFCTISGNSAWSGGAFYPYDSFVTITSCILYNDSGGEPEIHPGWQSTLDVSYSDVSGGYPGDGNIVEDPCFKGVDDFHLSGSSPCIDTGVDAGIEVDIDGDARPRLAGYDMGADEFRGGLEVFIEGYPACVEPGGILEFTTGVTNYGLDTEYFDEARLQITGPSIASRTIYLGPPYPIAPGAEASAPIALSVPPNCALVGSYTISVLIFLENSKISSAYFELEVAEQCN